MKTALFAGMVSAALSAATLADGGATVSFDFGPAGWAINGAATIVGQGGNPGAHLHHVQPDTFGIRIRNTTNTNFVTDFTQTGPVRLSVDIKVNSIAMNGNEVSRDLVLELRDYDVDGPEGYHSVWFVAGELPAAGTGYQTFEFIIDNVHDTELPAGWGGVGAWNPGPVLPESRNWTDMLQSIDEVILTTYVPGFFYGFTAFDIEVDNISIEPIEPACPADVSGDGTIDLADLNTVLGSFGQATDVGDTNGDGEVDLADLNAVLAAFGQACP